MMMDDRIILPPVCRKPMLEHFHSGHLGQDKMKSLARSLCWWPTLNADIANYVGNCTHCSQHKPKSHSNWRPCHGGLHNNSSQEILHERRQFLKLIWDVILLQKVDDWLKSIGVIHHYTPPSERFVLTLKSAIKSANPTSFSDMKNLWTTSCFNIGMQSTKPHRKRPHTCLKE